MKYTIMQIKNNKDCEYLFMDYSYAQDFDFSLNDYDEVYHSDMPFDDGETLEHFLDCIFTVFNIHRPENFSGHSMSVSDIIKLEDGRLFYCDPCGWKEIK